MRTLAVLIGVGLLSLACVGAIEGEMSGEEEPGAPEGRPGLPGAGGAAGPAGTPFMCGGQSPVSQAWKRLSLPEYRNTVRDLLQFAVGADATAVMNSLPMGELPSAPDGLQGTFARMHQELVQDDVSGWYSVAMGMGRSLTSATRIQAVMGACATDGVAQNDATCLTDFIRRFGERALRRPLDDQDVAFFVGFYGATPGVNPPAVADVIAGLLMAPEFLYHVEHGETAVPGKPGVFALTIFEVAARLSYHFLETMPDQTLWEAAKSGALKTPARYAQEVQRLFGDARVRPVIRNFYREWLRLDEVPRLDLNNADANFKAFAGADLPKSGLRASMIDEALALVEHYTWQTAGGVGDLLSTPLAFPRTAELAKIYQTPVWSAGEPPALPEGSRPGLFTRAAFLASGAAVTRPIHIGVFMRTGILCDEIPPPPGGDVPAPPAPDLRLSTRQATEKLTGVSPCSGCHATLINPLGFAMEGYDALGRPRTEERVFSKSGQEIGRLPVNTATVPQVVPGDMRPSRGPADLMGLIAESGRLPACLARNYFRFTFGRREDLDRDGCALETLRRGFAQTGSLRTAFREVANTAEFQQRTF